MPYKREGKVVFTKSGGSWRKKQTCASAENAKKAMKLLYGIESGMTPRKAKKKK